VTEDFKVINQTQEAIRAIRVLRERLEIKDHRDIKAQGHKVPEVYKDRLVQKVLEDSKEIEDRKGHRDKEASKALP
jgi:hypothetical protein